MRSSRSRSSRSAGSRSRANTESPAARLAETVRQILAARNLNLSAVFRKSRALFPGDPRYHISLNFYYDLQATALSPGIHQLLALSRITNYKLTDWLAVFGFRLDDIPHCEVILPARRTLLLDSTVYDSEARVPWFAEKQWGVPVPDIAPLGRILAAVRPRRADDLPHRSETRFLYAKIGWQDAWAFPHLLPGSIVRLETRSLKRLPHADSAKSGSDLVLVEHAKGLVCCRVHVGGNNRVTLRAAELPYAQIDFRLDGEARILGVVDLEFRPLVRFRQPELPRELAEFWTPLPLPPVAAVSGLRALLRQARLRSGLSFREASAKSRKIAVALGDRRYFVAASTLSDYETSDAPPRHIHKTVSLCILYSIEFWQFLRAAGIATEQAGREPMPDHLVPRALQKVPPESREETQMDLHPHGFLEALVEEFQEIPYFLRESLGDLTGLPSFSIRDVFWVGGGRHSLHPYLKGAVFVAVDRRRKRPASWSPQPLWEQPLYLLLKRDGSYLCARCSLAGNTLVVHPFSDGVVRRERYKNHEDAEVIGQIVFLVRKL
jgi:hypothetical protein